MNASYISHQNRYNLHCRQMCCLCTAQLSKSGLLFTIQILIKISLTNEWLLTPITLKETLHTKSLDSSNQHFWYHRKKNMLHYEGADAPYVVLPCEKFPTHTTGQRPLPSECTSVFLQWPYYMNYFLHTRHMKKYAHQYEYIEYDSSTHDLAM
jgi:hypothetical protein